MWFRFIYEKVKFIVLRVLLKVFVRRPALSINGFYGSEFNKLLNVCQIKVGEIFPLIH